jgi:hypothetical protein
MSKPLIIYLDSSDISNFSDPSKRTQELVDVEKQLLLWLEQGKIEFRFSHVHVIEAAPTAFQHVALATKRFSYIKQLCGYKCFVSPITILESEIKRLSGIDGDFLVLNDKGEWFPAIDNSDDFFNFEENYKKEIEAFPRKQRRAAERKYFDKNGNLNAKARENIQSSAPEVVKEICIKYPISQTNMDLAYQQFLKTGSMNLFLDEAKKSLADMDCIGEWYQRQWDLIIPNSSYLREIGENLKASFTPVSDNIRNLNEKSNVSGLSHAEINNLTNKSFNELLSTIPKGIAEKFALNLGVKLTQDVSWKLTPALMTLTTLFVSVARLIAVNGQKPRTSDFGDIYHAAFLPYVDVFRADASIASAIQQAKLPFKTLVVPKLVELPAQISQLLKHK